MRTIATIFAFLVALAPGLVQAQDVVMVVDTVEDDLAAAECTEQIDADPAFVGVDAGQCSLRQAITQANALGAAGQAEIYFDLGEANEAPFEIEVESELPALATANTTIDGTTQSGYVEEEDREDEDEFEDVHIQKPVVLSGVNCTDCRGVVVTAEGPEIADLVTIRGITVNNFDQEAFHVTDNAERVRISRNFIGTGWQGEDAQPNTGNATILVEGSVVLVTENLVANGAGDGIHVQGEATDVTIQESVVENNDGDGILFTGNPMDNFVFDNRVTNNVGYGIHVEAGEEIRLSQNRVFANLDPQILVAPGANLDIPAPEIVRAGYDGNEIWVEYRVSASPDDYAYPLDIEFFLSTDGSVTAEEFLGEDRYSRDNYLRNQRVRFFRPDFEGTSVDDYIVATATDDSGNTSQLTGVPDAIPVEFAGAPKVVHNDGAVILSWATLSEHNNAGFHVQQQIDGSFQDVQGAFVEGAGSSETLQNYEYTIENAGPGTHNFRLKQVDFDGTSAYSEVVSVTVPAQLDIAGPNPNPFSDETRVTLSVDEAQHVTVEVYDVLGRQVARLHDGQVAPDQPLDVVFDSNGLSSGQYLIRVQGETFSEVLRGVLVR